MLPDKYMFLKILNNLVMILKSLIIYYNMENQSHA